MDREKYVDESWKESASLEKEKLKEIAGKGARPAQSEAAQESQPSHSQDDHQPQSPSPSEPQAADQSEEENPAQMNFLSYLSGLAYQAMIFIGEIPHPETNLVMKNLEQAKFIIDTLTVLRAKTKGNLTKKEADFLNGSLYELQMKFVEQYQKEMQGQGPQR